MCKIVAFSNLNKVKLTDVLIQDIQSAMNTNDRDGFGYAVLGHDAELWGERTLETKLQSRFTLKKLSNKIPHKVKGNCFGKVSTKHKAGIFHARMSTNVKTLEATHPFVGNGIALIHNGVVSDMNPEPVKITTGNDTEILFQYWLKDGMKSIQDYASGYYALGVLDSNTGLLHIVKDSRASLYATYVKKIDSYLFATTKAIITEICESQGWTTGIIEELEDNIHIIMNGNNVVESKTIQPLGYASNLPDYLIKKSLGESASESLDEDDEYSYKSWADYQDAKYNKQVTTKSMWDDKDYRYGSGGKY